MGLRQQERSRNGAARPRHKTAKDGRRKGRKKNRLTARNADKHDLYQRSVQGPEEDSRFFQRLYKRMTGEPLRRFREDFCGTALLSCHFVKLHRENEAMGVDFHGPTLDWGRKHNVAEILDEDQRARLTLVQDDVLHVREPRVQLIAALNFSYCVFKTKDRLAAYVRNSFQSLEPGGLLCMDVWGGSETQVVMEEESDKDGFTYIWDQADFDPITYHATCKIHFEFKDGSRMRNAFVYDWRLWTIPDLREQMEAAGFEDVHVLWEGTDQETEEGNGVFRRVKKGEACEAWIAYVVGRKPK